MKESPASEVKSYNDAAICEPVTTPSFNILATPEKIESTIINNDEAIATGK